MKDLQKNCVTLSSFILTCIISANALANPTCSRTGAITVCGKGTLSNLHVAGKASLDGTTVIGKTEIAGMLDAKDVYLNALKVSGKATIYNSKIRGASKISGLLDTYHTKFYQKITISSDKTYLTDSYSRDIEVSRGGDKQILCLKNNTVVDGNIRFTTNRGMVVIDKSSKITGRVIGGYLTQNDFESHCKGEIHND